MNKSVTERWWDLYLNDDGCKKNFNGLHIVCALYGDDEEGSDFIMQSMAGNKNYQLENFEFTDNESLFKDGVFDVERSTPRGVFRPPPIRTPDIQVISGIRQRTFVPVGRRGGRRLQTWDSGDGASSGRMTR